MGASSVLKQASPRPASPKSPAKSKVGLRFWMERVLEECGRAAAGFEADPVHDLRVAIRRCRSLADGLMAMDPDPSWKEMKKAGRKLFRALGELRDMQVMQEWIDKLEVVGDSAAEGQTHPCAQNAQGWGTRTRKPRLYGRSGGGEAAQSCACARGGMQTAGVEGSQPI